MYKVAFVNDEDFERLPGKDMGGKVGVAYPEIGEAYVRKSGSKLIDTFSMMHELEHLEGKDLDEHFDSENKCYYKNFGDMFRQAGPSIMNAIPGFGPVMSSAVQMGRSARGPVRNFNSLLSETLMGAMYPNQEGVSDPAISQADGGAGGVGGGEVGGNAIRNLSNMPQFDDVENQRYGNISGRSPLMNLFGGQ